MRRIVQPSAAGSGVQGPKPLAVFPPLLPAKAAPSGGAGKCGIPIAGTDAHIGPPHVPAHLRGRAVHVCYYSTVNPTFSSTPTAPSSVWSQSRKAWAAAMEVSLPPHFMTAAG